MPTFRSLGPLRLAPLALCLLLLACDDPIGDVSPSDLAPGSSIVFVAGAELQILGPLEGPWRLVSMRDATLAQLESLDGQTAAIRLLGLHPDEYADPDEAEVFAADPDLKRVAEARRREIADYKAQALSEFLADRPLWFIRISDDEPALAYLFSPLASTPAEQGLGKKAHLINALALREGIASLKLDDPPHPFRMRMLDAQMAALAEILNRPAQASSEARDVWTRFDLKLPPPEFDPLIEEMETALGLAPPDA